MRNLTARLLRSSVWLAALAGFVLAPAAEPEGSVLTPAKRQDVLEQAKKLLVRNEASVVAVDPFHPEGFESFVAAMGRPAGPTTGTNTTDNPAPLPTGPRTERDLVQSIAAGLKPSGFFVLGGEPTLVFGQKRVKAGGALTITFEGNEYAIEIIRIAPPNFTLRLNREEFTRTIK